MGAIIVTPAGEQSNGRRQKMKQILKSNIINVECNGEKESFISVSLLCEVLKELMQEGKDIEVPIVGFCMIKKAFEGILEQGED